MKTITIFLDGDRVATCCSSSESDRIISNLEKHGAVEVDYQSDKNGNIEINYMSMPGIDL